MEITSDYLENVLFYGKGAGRYVTASAVVSDIIKCHDDKKWTYHYEHTDEIYPITYSSYYIRTNKPIDVDYDQYLTLGNDHIYITRAYEKDELLNKLGDQEYHLFKVR